MRHASRSTLPAAGVVRRRYARFASAAGSLSLSSSSSPLAASRPASLSSRLRRSFSSSAAVRPPLLPRAHRRSTSTSRGPTPSASQNGKAVGEVPAAGSTPADGSGTPASKRRATAFTKEKARAMLAGVY